MLLSEAPNGASFKVTKVALGKEVGRRLADMGFTEGAEGAVVRKGFFAGPLQIRILGYDILIRRYEASGIEVEPVGDWSAVHDAVKWFGGQRLRRRHLDVSAGGGSAPGREDPPREEDEQ
ncbi:MAG: ferrous iron transport protein A [Treponema sp.]|jgi:ferrous iron transport protein A|nr:ferrous iron transport protein A [Treponema sp.]